MIEDELSTSPVKLRAEIRRLRSLLPLAYSRSDYDYILTPRDEAIQIMCRYLCPLNGASEGTACACPGICGARAREIMSDLESEGFFIVRQLS